MVKEQVKYLSAVFICMFAHAGHISKEEAREISGLADHEFNKAYDAAANITGKTMQAKGKKMVTFLEHFAKEIEQDTDHYGGKLFDEIRNYTIGFDELGYLREYFY
ncbi:MAG: hypothetical protein ABF303_07350 [Desulfobacterales bacterium]